MAPLGASWNPWKSAVGGSSPREDALILPPGFESLCVQFPEPLLPWRRRDARFAASRSNSQLRENPWIHSEQPFRQAFFVLGAAVLALTAPAQQTPLAPGAGVQDTLGALGGQERIGPPSCQDPRPDLPRRQRPGDAGRNRPLRHRCSGLATAAPRPRSTARFPDPALCRNSQWTSVSFQAMVPPAVTVRDLEVPKFVPDDLATECSQLIQAEFTFTYTLCGAAAHREPRPGQRKRPGTMQLSSILQIEEPLLPRRHRRSTPADGLPGPGHPAQAGRRQLPARPRRRGPAGAVRRRRGLRRRVGLHAGRVPDRADRLRARHRPGDPGPADRRQRRRHHRLGLLPAPVERQLAVHRRHADHLQVGPLRRRPGRRALRLLRRRPSGLRRRQRARSAATRRTTRSTSWPTTPTPAAASTAPA